MIYSISYDLKQPGRNYAGLYEAIKSTGAWWHYLESTWLVDTAMSAARIYQTLAPFLDTNDRVLIAGITSDHEGWLPKAAWEWINQRTMVFA